MKNRFVISTLSYHNCPVCDLGSPGYELKGYATIEEVMDFALIGYPDEAVDHVFDTITESEYEFAYETGRHCFTGIIVKEKGTPIFRTIDDGKGVLIWDEI